MITVLISKPSFVAADWLNIVRQSCAEASFQHSGDLLLEKDKAFFAQSVDSLCGVGLLYQSKGLKVSLESLPSRKDLRLFTKIIDYALLSSCSFSDEVIRDKFAKTESFDKLFNDIWTDQFKKEAIHLSRSARKVNLKLWLASPALIPFAEQAPTLLNKLHAVSMAKEAEVFAIDDKNSIVWDGSSTWVAGAIDQVLFSQKYFKGNICGEISSEKIIEVLKDKIIPLTDGYVLPEAGELSHEDMSRLNAELVHYKQKERQKRPVQLSIEAGRLEEMAYTMSKALFRGRSLTKVVAGYAAAGVPEAQLEVATLAVSRMLEVAATSRGESLESMQKKLKDKCKLSPEAAYAITCGFVNAVKEVPITKKEINWLRLALFLFFIGTIIWFFFLR